MSTASSGRGVDTGPDGCGPAAQLCAAGPTGAGRPPGRDVGVAAALLSLGREDHEIAEIAEPHADAVPSVEMVAGGDGSVGPLMLPGAPELREVLVSSTETPCSAVLVDVVRAAVARDSALVCARGSIEVWLEQVRRYPREGRRRRLPVLARRHPPDVADVHRDAGARPARMGTACALRRSSGRRADGAVPPAVGAYRLQRLGRHAVRRPRARPRRTAGTGDPARG